MEKIQVSKENFLNYLQGSINSKFDADYRSEALQRLNYEISLLNDCQIEFFCFIFNTIQSMNICSNLLFPELRSSNSLILYLLNASCIDPIEFDLHPDIFYKYFSKDGSISVVLDTPIQQTAIFNNKNNKLTLKADKNVIILNNLFKHKYISLSYLKTISGQLISHLFGKNQWCFDPCYVDDNALGIKAFRNMYYLKDAIKEPTFEQLISVLPINYDGGVIDNVAYAMTALGDDYKSLPLTQDSLYKLLINHQMPSDRALSFCKSSKLQHSLTNEEKLELKRYNLHKDLHFIGSINYLIPRGHVITNAIIGLYLYYYKVNEPEMFYQYMLETCLDNSISINEDHKIKLVDEDLENRILARLLILEAQYRGIDVSLIINDIMEHLKNDESIEAKN